MHFDRREYSGGNFGDSRFAAMGMSMNQKATSLPTALPHINQV